MKTKGDAQLKRVYTKLIILILCILFNGNVFAQQEDTLSANNINSVTKEFNNAINMCPGGIIFGIYSFNYEYLIKQSHGIVARFDYESVSETLDDDNMDADGYGFTLNYRWHWNQKMGSFFVGSFLRYKIYNGNATANLEAFEFTLREATLGLNIGKRWVWNSGLNIAAAFGYGVSSLTKETEPTSESIESTLDKFIDGYDFIGPFYGEISIGYAY